MWVHESSQLVGGLDVRIAEVDAQDWLIEPIAADCVPQVLAETALGEPPADTKVIAGPERIRLPELTTGFVR